MPSSFSDLIYSVKMHNKKIMRSNQDESDSEEYDKDMDIDKEIIVKVMCNAAAAD